MKRGTEKIRITGMAAGLLILVFVSFLAGRYPLSVRDIAICLKYGISPEPPPADANLLNVFYRIRVPRIFLACITGAALSVAGTAYQAVFQNVMASPDILGASSGAAFGAALFILLSRPAAEITGAAFLFSVLTVFFSWFISEKGQGKKVQLLILSGMAVSSLMNAGISYLKLAADPESQLAAITYWLMGSLSGAETKDLLTAGIPVLVGSVPLFMLRWRINLLTLGDEEADTLGIDAGKLRKTVILCSTLITAATVSVTGIIGWVGLLVPHICRRIVGNNCRFLLPASMIFGAGFLLAVDDITRILFPAEIPIGILTSFIGVPFFLYLITRKGDRL